MQKQGVTLPLVCIGDSPQNCGLGGGGVLAMQDAIELSKVLLAPGGFAANGHVNLPPIRDAEVVMLARKTAFNDRKKGDARLRPRDPEQPPNYDLAKGIGAGLVPVPVEELSPDALAKVRNTAAATQQLVASCLLLDDPSIERAAANFLCKHNGWSQPIGLAGKLGGWLTPCVLPGQ